MSSLSVRPPEKELFHRLMGEEQAMDDLELSEDLKSKVEALFVQKIIATPGNLHTDFKKVIHWYGRFHTQFSSPFKKACMTHFAEYLLACYARKKLLIANEPNYLNEGVLAIQKLPIELDTVIETLPLRSDQVKLRTSIRISFDVWV